ncbi:MAG: penicillin-binding transpeptidase domain-containing protein [Hyphomonadaceae bacterium]
MAVDREGGVRALIGGTDYNTSKFNRVTRPGASQARPSKLSAHTAALESGLSTEDVRYDEPVVIDGWLPRNYDGDGYRGAVTLRTAFALPSTQWRRKSPTKWVRAGSPTSPAGLASTICPNATSLCPCRSRFGSIETTLWDMTSAFSTFMDQGLRVDPYIVQRVTNSAGQELYTRPPYNAPRVLDPEVVRNMTSLLGAVVLRGTGTAARLGSRDVAGKTGTSSDWRDAWFVGFSADFTAGVWVGHDDFTSMGRTTGGTLPAQIWADTMRVAHEGVEEHPLKGLSSPCSPRRS